MNKTNKRRKNNMFNELRQIYRNYRFIKELNKIDIEEIRQETIKKFMEQGIMTVDQLWATEMKEAGL